MRRVSMTLREAVFTTMPGATSYAGTTRNGVTSNSYGTYPSGSYKVEKTSYKVNPNLPPAATGYPYPVHADYGTIYSLPEAFRR